MNFRLTTLPENARSAVESQVFKAGSPYFRSENGKILTQPSAPTGAARASDLWPEGSGGTESPAHNRQTLRR